MDYIIDILLYNSYIELPGSNQTFSENKDSLNSPGQSNRGKRTCYTMRSQRGLEKVLGEIKRKQRGCVKLHHTKDICAILL